MTMIMLLISAAALAPQDTAAQEPATLTPVALPRQVDVSPVPVAAPPGRPVDIISGGDIALEVDEENSELALGYTWVASSRQIVGAEGRDLRLARSAFNIELSLPVGGADNLLESDTFEGLGDGPSLSFSWTWFSNRASDRLGSEQFTRIIEEARQRCLRGLTPPGVDQRPSAENCNFRADHPTVRFAREYSGLSERAINRAILSPGWAFGIEGSIGVNEFDYRTPVTLAENTDTEPQFSVKVYGSLFPSDMMSVWTLSAEYENGFKARDDEILCRAVVVDANEDCVSAAPGPPRKNEALLFALEHRRVLGTIRSVGQFAIAPQVTFEALSGEFELSLPVYLTLERDLGLLPGVTVTYNSEEDDLSFGVFLKRSFSF